MKKIFFILGLFLLVGSAVSAQKAVPDTVQSAPGITIETEIDKSEIYIGDLINYRLTVYFDSTIDLKPPPIGANLGAFDVKDYKADEDVNLGDGRKKIESRFLLTTFTTGDYIIPPIPIQYKTADSTARILISEPISIRVKSLLAEGDDTLDIRDIKAPFDFKTSKAWLYYLIGAVLLLGGLAFYLIWRKRRKAGKDTGPVDLRKPWEIAFEDLAVLNEKNYPQKGEFKLYYIELSEIVRAFLGRIYDIPVLDMTTDEFMDNLSGMEVDEQLFTGVKQFLNHADLVKFAKWVPDLERTEIDFKDAHSMIEFLMQSELNRLAALQAAAASKKAPVGGSHV